VPELNYDAKADILSLPAFGEVAGVATNSKGHVFVYARTGHAVATLGDERTFYHGGSRLFQFDPAGKLVKEIGQGVYAVNFAQQVRIDPQDNIWIVDAGSSQVVKFDADERYRLVLGRAGEHPGASVGLPARFSTRLKGERPKPSAAVKAVVAADAAPRRRRAGVRSTGPGRDWDRAGNIYVADGFGNNNRIASSRRTATS
jgi:DNA-binding beta-propeller fold protein YncE